MTSPYPAWDTWPGYPDYPGDDVFVAWEQTPCARPGCAGKRWHHGANAMTLARGFPWVWAPVCRDFVEPLIPPDSARVVVPPPPPQQPQRAYRLAEPTNDETETEHEAALQPARSVR